MKEFYFIFDKTLNWGGRGKIRRFKNGRISPSVCPLNRHNQASDSPFAGVNRDELLFIPFFCLFSFFTSVVCRVLSLERQEFRYFRLRKIVSFKPFPPINRRRFLFFIKYPNFHGLNASSLFSRDFDSFVRVRSRRPFIHSSLMMANREDCRHNHHNVPCVKLRASAIT